MYLLGKTQVSYKPKRRTLPLNGAAWARLRAEVLAEEPLCVDCQAMGYVTPSREVDHIVDSREDYDDDNGRHNLQGLCETCHSRKTAVGMGKASNAGCDVLGRPLDESHPWNHQ
jgi:5-methylcytosine-specific restriction endonuclease McrA